MAASARTTTDAPGSQKVHAQARIDIVRSKASRAMRQDQVQVTCTGFWRILQALLMVVALLAAPITVSVTFFYEPKDSASRFEGVDGQIKFHGAVAEPMEQAEHDVAAEQGSGAVPGAATVSIISPGEQGSVVNASRFGIPFQMGSKYYEGDVILHPSTRFPTLKVDQSGGGNPNGKGSLDESVSSFVNFRRTAFDFDFNKGRTSSRRPPLHYQHNSIVVEQPSFDVCEYHGPPPPFVAGAVPPIENAFGKTFTPMLFAPAKFYSFKNLHSQVVQEVNEVCVAYITECPLTPTSDAGVAKYCQETSCISDQYLPGYKVLPANESLTVSASPSSETITASNRRTGSVFYRSSLKLPYAELTDALNPFTGCLTSSTTGEPGNCRQPGVSLVSYHTHHSPWEGAPLMMQVSNPETTNDVKSGPADVSFDADYFARHLGYRLDPAKLQNCHKITAGVVKPAYVQNIAPWPFFGENVGGDAWGPNGPERDPSATYSKLLTELNRFTPEELDVVWDYRVGTFPLSPATPTMRDRQYNVHLEKIALCMLKPDFDTDCYANFEAADPHSEVVDTFRKVTAILCLFYPALFALQKCLFSQQHDRFGPHAGGLRMALKLHVWVGIWIIFAGATFVFCNWSEPLSFHDYHANSGAWEVLFLITGACGILHALTTYRMLTAVQGDRRLTIPMYIVAGSLNLANSILLLRDYNKHEFELSMLREYFLHEVDAGLNRFLLLWASMTTFIYVRAHIVLMTLFKIHYYTAYTYAIIGAAAITYPLSGQTPWVYLGLALFVVYAPLHSHLVRILGCFAFEKQNSEQATSKVFTDQVLVDLLRYRIAQGQGDLEEMSRIEQQGHFGDILAAEAELSKSGKHSIAGEVAGKMATAAGRWKELYTTYRMSKREVASSGISTADGGKQEKRLFERVVNAAALNDPEQIAQQFGKASGTDGNGSGALPKATAGTNPETALPLAPPVAAEISLSYSNTAKYAV